MPANCYRCDGSVVADKCILCSRAQDTVSIRREKLRREVLEETTGYAQHAGGRRHRVSKWERVGR